MSEFQKISEPNFISLGFAGIAIFLITAGVLQELTEYSAPARFSSGVLTFFTPKGLIPTVFLVSLLLWASFLLFRISRKVANPRAGSRYYWIVLSILFLLLAIDESVRAHERLGDFLNFFFGKRLSGYSWTLIYSPFILLFGVIYLPFLKSLPPPIRKSFIISGIITFFGAFLCELILGELNFHSGSESFASGIFGVLKKGCELIGIIVFVDILYRQNLIEKKDLLSN